MAVFDFVMDYSFWAICDKGRLPGVFTKCCVVRNLGPGGGQHSVRPACNRTHQYLKARNTCPSGGGKGLNLSLRVGSNLFLTVNTQQV